MRCCFQLFQLRWSFHLALFLAHKQANLALYFSIGNIIAILSTNFAFFTLSFRAPSHYDENCFLSFEARF